MKNMRKIIKAIKRQQMSGQNGPWTKIMLKFQDTGDQIFELGRGFDKYTKERLAAGQELQGYVTQRTWQGQNGGGVTNTFNAITAEYVYSLLLKIKPDIESVKETSVGTTKETGWEGDSAEAETEVVPEAENLWDGKSQGDGSDPAF